MDITMAEHKRRSKFSSLTIAIAVHALILGLALQSSSYIIPSKKPIIELIQPLEEIQKPIDKDIPIKPTDLMPPKPFMPPTPFLPETFRDPVIFEFDNLPPMSDTTLKPTVPAIKEGGDLDTNRHSPIYQAAIVDAKACEKPQYPSNSLRTAEEGTVHLAMQIGIDGRVLDARVEKSSGYKSLDRAAIAGLSLCKFKPANTDGIPEKAWTKLQYVWTLDQ